MTFPQSIAPAKSQNDQLIYLIQQEIRKAQDFISFARFMELALYAPELGYYTAGTHKFGSKGDFVTAPLISPLFARCLARQCSQVIKELKKADILEIGAGTGLLAKDLLLELESLDCLPEHYFIFEISADLRSRQQALLKKECPHLFSRIEWLDNLPQESFTGLIIANEVIDALPVHCFEIKNKELFERGVTWSNDHFEWATKPPATELAEHIDKIQMEYPLPENYLSEVNLQLPAWIKMLANTLKQGVILIFDYGYGRGEYYHPDRTQGTLMCYHQHQRHDNPFTLIGLQDITAHVDFTHVVESALDAHLTFGGYTTQSSFLLASELTDIANANVLSSVDTYKQNQAIKTLTLPSQMGEAIKVMGLTKDFDTPLLGFSLYERSRDL